MNIYTYSHVNKTRYSIGKHSQLIYRKKKKKQYIDKHNQNII